MIGQPLHGTAVACRLNGVWRGVWITGPSGAGKSDLALRLMARGWRLVADDYAYVFTSGGAVWATAPERIAGKIEARGVGVRPACLQGLARLDLVVELVDGAVERLPDPETVVLAGVATPVLRLDAREASAAEKVALALVTL